MHTPYTQNFEAAFQAAHASTGAVLGAVLLARPFRTRPSNLLFGAALAVTTLLFPAARLLRELGLYVPAALPQRALPFVILFAVAAAMFEALLPLGAAAAASGLGLAVLLVRVNESQPELVSLTLVWLGALLALHIRRLPAAPGAGPPLTAPASYAPTRAHALQDLGMAAFAIFLASVVSIYVMHRGCESADEVANTFQAGAFAKFRAYGEANCSPALASYWVFDWQGRRFSQYTPGWPLFMAPFVRVGLTWLAGPFSLGLMVAISARLARRVAAEGLPGVTPRQISAAGLVAGLGATLGSTMLINGGSRFSHLYSAFLFGSAVEALCVITRAPSRARQWAWGAAFGAAAATLLGTRPAEGAFLGVGLAVYAVYSLARRRVPWRAAAAGALAFALLGGLYLVILRLQVGKWFATGYSLVPFTRTGENPIAFSIPKLYELKYALPLATGSYCWWPCAPALGLAGLLTARRPGFRVPFMLGIGSMALVAFVSTISFGRYVDWGYGPRYLLPIVVPMAVGGGVLLGPLLAPLFSRDVAARDGAARGAPERALAALVVVVALGGVLEIAPLVYPYNYQVIGQTNQVFDAIKAKGLHNAVVVVKQGTASADPRFYTQNLPVELFPEQDVIIAHDIIPSAMPCVRELLPNRTFYRTVGAPNVTIEPFPAPGAGSAAPAGNTPPVPPAKAAPSGEPKLTPPHPSGGPARGRSPTLCSHPPSRVSE